MTREHSPPGADGYERSDARPRSLVVFGLSLAVLIGLSLAVSGWIDRRTTARIRAHDRPAPLSELRAPPSGPALETLTTAELEAVRAREEELLTSSAWIDPVNGIVRIPIERALEIVAREGLPAQAFPPQEGGHKQ